MLIDELWEQLRHYEDKLSTSSTNLSKSPSSDSPKDRHERRKLKALVVNSRGAKEGHTGYQRKLSPLKDTDVQSGLYHRHQVFDIPKPTVEYASHKPRMLIAQYK